MKKLLFGILGLLVTISGWSAETDSGPISSVTVAGLVAQNGTPTPTTPIDIMSNNGVLKVSKNLFDYEYFYDNYQMYSPSSVGRCPIKLKPNTQYTISSNEEASSSSAKVFVVSGSAIDWAPASNVNGVLVNSPRTVTTDSDGYLCLGFYVSSGSAIPESDFINGTAWVQIEQGTTATPYKPYGQIYTDGEVETIADSANHTANVATLLGVGDYRDTQNINTGAITRKVGVKVLDGTENWERQWNGYWGIKQNSINMLYGFTDIISNQYQTYGTRTETDAVEYGVIANAGYVFFKSGSDTAGVDSAHWKQYLADQYANGTPVMIVYPLATETTESVAAQTLSTAPVSNATGGVTGMTITTLLSSGASVVTTIAADAIKIATTAYNSARFSPVVTELNDTIATIRSVVTNTINQTKAIADLQATKQTRPNEQCPAGKKCLLVEDNDGTPHWYEIIENAYGLPNGYTALEYIESTGTQYIDTGVTINDQYSYELRYTLNGAGQSMGGIAGKVEFRENNSGSLKGFVYGSNGAWSDENYSARDFTTTYKLQENKLYANGTLINTFTPRTFTSTVNFNLFRRNIEPDSSFVIQYASGKLAYFKMWDNGNLVRDFIPARRESDGVLGMYDLADNNPATAFHTNAGTGTFVEGPAVQ